ncbi:MAG: YciK family oxidoreductase [Kangiellaceae bacterium]|nr:YciK family oxidoreductase [Kangiellaceae bacterium]|tara:strand:- start:1771 stop:2520 length:750 start_codon:yes stop_codon:yes gene_type:complete
MYLDYQPADDLLKDKTILVTGASSGIGKAVSLGAAKCGATVILLGKNMKKLEAVYDEIEASGGPQPAIYPLNLEGASPKDYHDMAETIGKEFNQLDGLVNNAGILGGLTPIANYDIENWYRVLQVNLNSAFVVTQMLLPLLKKAYTSSIIFTGSGVGRKGRAYWGAYAISKFGVEGLNQVLADELEENTRVRCNCVNPGKTRTEMRRSAYPGEDPQTLITPEQLVPAYLYLLSDESMSVHGQSIDLQSK